MDPSATAAATAARAPVPVRVFARGFALRAAQTAWLLGAGASADAGVPTAGQLIDELLAILYCSENGIRHADLTRDPRWQQRVRGFYDGRYGLPAWPMPPSTPRSSRRCTPTGMPGPGSSWTGWLGAARTRVSTPSPRWSPPGWPRC